MFRGEYFTGEDDINTPTRGWSGAHKEKIPPNELHKDLRDRFRAIQKVQQELIREKAYVSGYIEHVLLETDSMEDLLLLMPEALSGTLKEHAKKYLPFSTGRQLSDEEIESIKTKNETFIEAMKLRMMQTLLKMR